MGVGVLRLPELGLVHDSGPVLAAFLASIVGGAAGALIGGLAGALIGWTSRQKDTRRC
jgi:hypothetical protein